MQNSVIFYLSAAAIIHFGIVLAMAFLITAGYSIRIFLAKEPEPHLTGAILSGQIRFLLPVVAISTLISCLALLLPAQPGQIINAAAIVIDVGAPLAVMARTLKTTGRD